MSETGPGITVRKRLFTIPPTAPFLESLAKAVLAGELPVPGGPAPEPLALPAMTIYLPTRRAARALREAFLAAAKGSALLLPRILALGDPDEEALLFGTDEAGDTEAGMPAISALSRRLALMRLILAWGQRLGFDPATATDPHSIGRLPMTPAQASALAADLGRFMDFVETEGADLSALAKLVPDELAVHWQQTLQFLEIVTEHWPAYLRDNGLVSPAARRNALMAQEAQRLASGTGGPVIAAGSTGSVPATAELLDVIASLPNGAVVLPGLDLDLDDASWTKLEAAPEHPQAGMAELLRRIGVTRADVAILPGTAPAAGEARRLKLISEALRPAESTARWQDLLGTESAVSDCRAALDGIEMVAAPSPQDEAEVIALMLRKTIETPGKTAALVTPDRTLARRVSARLQQFGLAIDDSAGLPVARTVPGAFLDLVLDAAASNFAPAHLMALLKHPLARLGRPAAAARSAARALERLVFRDIYLGEGLPDIAATLASEGDGLARRPKRFDRREREAAQALVADLERAFASLLRLKQEDSASAASFADAHAATAEALARDETGRPDRLWQGEAGEALSVFLSRMMDEGGQTPLGFRDYPPFYRGLLAGEVVRPAGRGHPRLAIWGPLEARLQRPDLLILGGLNEGSWPRVPDPGPWLNRAMRTTLGLPAPERRIGLAAHDFAQSLGPREVVLTRALKVDGVPTVPSRWLQRLETLCHALGLADALTPFEPWLGWARARDLADGFYPAKPPSPTPPLDARPRRLSVTRIGRWIANPYEIFARDILKLEQLQPLGEVPEQALRGNVVHAALSEFARRYPTELPADSKAALVEIADSLFARLGTGPTIEAFWRPAFECFATWFAATEPGRRAGMIKTLTEISGSHTLPGLDFTLTARIDRIDLGPDGSAVIYDYKTGRTPKPSRVDELHAPQLPLEALIVARGGVEGEEAAVVKKLLYIKATGRAEGGEAQAAGNRDPSVLAAAALEALTRLVQTFDNASHGYTAMRRAGFKRDYDYDAYAQLARVAEWTTSGEDEP